jgi:hypothetical protein
MRSLISSPFPSSERREGHEMGMKRRIPEAFRTLLRAALGLELPISQPPLRAPAISTSDPELDPLVSFLRVWFAREIEAGMMLVIEDHTKVDTFYLRGSYEDYVDGLLKEACEQATAELIRNFGDRNRESRAVWPELMQFLPSRLLSREERYAIFKDDAYEGWKRFYERYPKAAGLVTVSRVGLNREKDRALFYLACCRGALAAVGGLQVLERVGDLWVQPPVWIGPRWIS